MDSQSPHMPSKTAISLQPNSRGIIKQQVVIFSSCLGSSEGRCCRWGPHSSPFIVVVVVLPVVVVVANLENILCSILVDVASC